MLIRLVLSFSILVGCSLSLAKKAEPGKTNRKVSSEESVPESLLKTIQVNAKNARHIQDEFKRYAPNMQFDENKLSCRFTTAVNYRSDKDGRAILCSISVGQRPFDVCIEQDEYDGCIEVAKEPEYKEAFFYFRAEANGRISRRYKPVGDSSQMQGNPIWCTLFNVCAA